MRDTYSEEHAKTGSLFMVCSTQADAGLTVLCDYIDKCDRRPRAGMATGGLLALLVLLLIVMDNGVSITVGLPALALVLLIMRSGNGDSAGTLLQVLGRDDKY